MSYRNLEKLHELFSRMKYRSWIRSQLQQAGGEDYLKHLEVDIGAEPGYFRSELDKKLIPGKKRAKEESNGAAGWNSPLPSIRLPPGKV